VETLFLHRLPKDLAQEGGGNQARFRVLRSNHGQRTRFSFDQLRAVLLVVECISADRSEHFEGEPSSCVGRLADSLPSGFLGQSTANFPQPILTSRGLSR